MRDFKQWARVRLVARRAVTRGVAQSRDSVGCGTVRGPSIQWGQLLSCWRLSQLLLTDREAEARGPSDAVTTSSLLDRTGFAQDDLGGAVQTATPSAGL